VSLKDHKYVSELNENKANVARFDVVFSLST
jgi:hypothetical protein